VGVHEGPVVAGVVGQERYQFDIWGDTVNVAARMAGMAPEGGVALTEALWNRISGNFDGSTLGDMEVKGKGTIAIYEVKAERAG
jgi:adenylate cyclase